MTKDTFAWNKIIQEMNKPFNEEWAQDKVAVADIPEQECDQQILDDMNAIGAMLEASEKEGLQCEVVYQLIQGKINNIPRECQDALYEWDI